jgi:predicted RNA binding protein YcfA (HicA-like mRNA interferase family)
LPELRGLSGRDVCRALGRLGYLQVRQHGSHIVMQKQSDAGTVTIPVPDHDELAIGTLSAIIRKSGVPRSEFEA